MHMLAASRRGELGARAMTRMLAGLLVSSSASVASRTCTHSGMSEVALTRAAANPIAAVQNREGDSGGLKIQGRARTSTCSVGLTGDEGARCSCTTSHDSVHHIGSVAVY